MASPSEIRSFGESFFHGHRKKKHLLNYFFFSFRIMHHRLLYKHIHKIHHEWTAPVSIIGIYAHPIEHVISNLLPVFMGPFIMGSHIASIWMWSCMVISSTQVSHGGYHLPFLPSPEAHDFHHLK